MKFKRLAAILGVVLALALGLALAAPAVENQAECVNKELCAEKLRFGGEAFSRGDFSTAKAYFREAVQADPTSVKAWSFYDLSVMYDVAEQVKRAGKVETSGAPVFDPNAAPAAPSASAPAKAPAPLAPAVPALPEDEGC